MHPFAYRLMAGLNRATLAPNDDSGHEADDEFDNGGDEFDDEFDDEQDPSGDDDEDEFDEEHEDDDGEVNGRQQPSQQRQSRGESRQARLARENRELRERQDKLQSDLDAIRRTPAQPQGETPEQLNARLNAMDPVERIAEIQRLTTANTNAMVQNLAFQIADTSDATKFNGLMARNPKLSKHASEVEKRLGEYRKQGMNIPREDVLKHILGEKALESAGRTSGRAKRAADERREAQRGRPGGSRSDGGREGRSGGNDKSARDRRLENLKI